MLQMKTLIEGLIEESHEQLMDRLIESAVEVRIKQLHVQLAERLMETLM